MEVYSLCRLPFFKGGDFKMINKIQNVDEYLDSLPDAVKRTLLTLRKQIKESAPDAIEGISYNIPTFKLNGRPLVSLAAAKKHCAFYILSPKVVLAHKEDLKEYNFEGGAIRFTTERPLIGALVKKLVKARIAEIVL